MGDEPQTWHHGLVAEWWEEFNDDFRPHELAYFREFVAGGQPALDAGCGSGRLLVPLLRAGFDVDGVDVSPDMIAACRRTAEAEGLAPQLAVQALHELDMPRCYRTIFVCGSFGVGSDRRRDAEALRRFHDHLEPGGTLLVDTEAPYADPRLTRYWAASARDDLPEPPARTDRRRRASDGTEYSLASRIVDVDPFEQRVVLEMHAERWRDGAVQASEDRRLDIAYYFPLELAAMIERAGFRDVEIHGEHQRRPATADDSFVVVVARR